MRLTRVEQAAMAQAPGTGLGTRLETGLELGTPLGGTALAQLARLTLRRVNLSRRTRPVSN